MNLNLITLFALESASSPHTSSEKLDELATIKNDYIRAAVAGNPNTDKDTLSALAIISNDAIRYVCAKNPNTPAKILSFLSQDKNKDPCILKAIIGNPNTSPETLSMLFHEISTDVDPISRNHWQILQIFSVFAKNPNTPAEILSSLSQNSNVYVRWTIAENPNTPAETLLFLSRDTENIVRSAVIKNPNTPSEALSLPIEEEEMSNVKKKHGLRL